MNEIDRLKIRCDSLPNHLAEQIELIVNSTTLLHSTSRDVIVAGLHALIDDHLFNRNALLTERVGRERQVAAITRDYNRAEAGRVTLIHGLDRVENGIDRLELGGQISADAANALRKLTTEAVDKHRQVWSR
jgi:hypothetical protein